MGMFIPDPTRPHLRYPADFIREAQALAAYRIARTLGKWTMTMGNPARPRDVETAHSHLVAQVKIAKADVIGRLESGDRDWYGLRKAIVRYIEFQTAADVLSGQTKIAATLSG